MYVTSTIRHRILTWLYPGRCVCCQNFIKDDEADCCDLCYNEVTLINNDYCIKCGKIHLLDDLLCFDCKKQNHYFEKSPSHFADQEGTKAAIEERK